MPRAAAPHLPRPAGRSRPRRPPAGLRARARPAGRRSQRGCSAQLLEGETEANVCAAAVDVLAEIGGPEALPALTPLRGRASTATLSSPSHQGRHRPHRRARPAADVTEIPRGHRGGIPPVCEFLYRRTGMVFTEAKRYYVERRVADRMAPPAPRPSRAISPGCAATWSGEVEQFVNAFTVNETYFYREDHQLRCLTTDLLAERVLRKAAGRGACASGRCRARPAKSPIRSPSGCWRTGRRSTPTTSRSSAPTSTPRVLDSGARAAYSASAR